MAKTTKSVPSVSKIKVQLSTFKQGIDVNTNEFCLPFKTGKMAYNYFFKSGALTTGLGITSLTIKNTNYPNPDAPNEKQYYPALVPSGFYPVRCWHYRHYDSNNNFEKADKLLFVGTNNRLLQYLIPSSNYGIPDSIGTITLSGKPVDAINYRLNNRDIMILTYENSPMQIYDASNPNETKLTTVSDAPNIISMCVHYERLFAVVSDNRNAVYFSQELDPTQWSIDLDGAGFIEMIDERGELTRVISFGGYVYIFREYGIAKLTAYAEQEDFVVSQLFTSCGRIYEDTIAVCGNRILFLAEDGLYSFDGNTTTKLIMNIEKMFEGSNNAKAVGAYYQGKYYLACRLNFDDDKSFGCETCVGYVNNAIVQIDLKTGDLNLTRGFDISFFTSVTETSKSQLVCCHNSLHELFIGEVAEGNGTAYGPDLPKFWATPTTDFGYPRNKKIIREIHIVSKYESTLKIKSDLEEKTINISGSDKQQKFKVYVKGNTFSFEFETTTQYSLISSPDFVVDVIN